MEPIKLIIFDLDGTLFRTETVDIEAFNKALIKNGYPEKSDEEILNLIGLPLDDICRKLLDSDERQRIAQFAQDVISFEEEAIFTSGQLYDGVEEFLTRFKARGFTICICSNGNKEYVTAIVNKFGLGSLFEEIWYEKNGITKIEAVKIITEKFRAKQFIMVGDRLCDIEAAKKNGGISIGVTYGFGKEEVKHADFTAGSIQDVEDIILQIYSS